MLETGLEIFWYVIIIAAITCYAMLDGFDLGVGALHLFTSEDTERRVFLNAIGPVWDGNEVWLVVLVGALFAGFPFAYATLFSVLYFPLIILICALIFRAVAIEFRSRLESKAWRNTWDVLFFLASVLIALAVGVALGNLVHGIPIDANHDSHGGMLLTFLHPYAILIGVLTLALFMMHGSIFLVMKTEGELQNKLKRWINPTIIFFIMAYVVTTFITLIYQQHMIDRIKDRPYLFVIVLFNVLAIANIPHQIRKGNPGWAFISSCANIALLMVLFAIGTFPDLVRSSLNPENSLTIFNSAASTTTLTVLMVIVIIGLPLVAAYSFYIYRIFRGKVQLDHMSY